MKIITWLMNIVKIILFLFVYSFFIINIEAQELIQNKINPKEYKPSLIELKRFSTGSHTYIFIDQRDDTTRMGFFWGSNRQYYFMFPKPATIYLTEKINNKNEENTVDTLYIGIKRLWISQLNIPPTLARTFLLNSYSTIGYCRVICNFYKKKAENYYLIGSYDNTVSKNGYLGNTKEKLMEENLTIMRKKADSIAENGLNTKIVYYPNIKSLKPILSAKKLNDGIYLTFQDFINNKPVDIDFSYSVSNNASEKIILNVARENDSLYTEQCWGFCKNNTPYMRVGSKFSILTRIENTYELRAIETLKFKHANKLNTFWLGFNISSRLLSELPELFLLDIATHKNSPNTIIRTAPFKLDMETGEVY